MAAKCSWNVLDFPSELLESSGKQAYLQETLFHLTNVDNSNTVW